MTPLMMASKQGHLAVVNSLLEHDARLDTQDDVRVIRKIL